MARPGLQGRDPVWEGGGPGSATGLFLLLLQDERHGRLATGAHKKYKEELNRNGQSNLPALRRRKGARPGKDRTAKGRYFCFFQIV